MVTGAAPATRSRGYIESGRARGRQAGGRRPQVSRMQGYENGFFLGGTLFDNVTPDMKIYKEEIFGPVLGVRARHRTTRRAAR